MEKIESKISEMEHLEFSLLADRKEKEAEKQPPCHPGYSRQWNLDPPFRGPCFLFHYFCGKMSGTAS